MWKWKKPKISNKHQSLTTGSRGKPGPPETEEKIKMATRNKSEKKQETNSTADANSPGTWTGTRPRGRRTSRCLAELPPAWQPGSAMLRWDTAAPWQCECPGPAQARATAEWVRTTVAPPGAYRCIAAATERAAAHHYHRDLEINPNM